jgi:PAS domain S-box-containing protein
MQQARLILNVDQTNTITSVNDSFCSLMGVTKSAVEAQPAFDILRPAATQVEHLQALLSDASMGRPGSILLRSSDTSAAVHYVKVLPLSDNLNRISHILAIVIDIPSPGDQTSV